MSRPRPELTARRPCRQVPTGHPDRANVPDRVNVTPGRASTTRAARRWTGEPGGTVRGIRVGQLRVGQQGGVGDTTGSPRHTGPADAGRSRGPVTGPAAGDVAHRAHRTRGGDPGVPGRADVQARRAPRPEPRHRRADHGAAPGLRLPERPDRCSTPVTRPTCTRSSPAARRSSTRLRTRGGLSGYPNRAESEHDWIENSHASTSLSYADGMAKAFALRGETDRTVVAVIGDGALTGGMAWEALNNIAGGRPAAGDRAQRQRSLLRADHRWHGPADGGAATAPRLRADARPGQAHPAAGPRRRPAAVRGAARREIRGQGLVRAADHVRRPRSEVRRAGRRARRRGAGPGPAGGPRLPRPGGGALRHPQGPGLPPGGVGRRRADALAARLRPGHRQAGRRDHHHLDARVRPGDGGRRRRTARRRRDHRRHVRADRV